MNTQMIVFLIWFSLIGSFSASIIALLGRRFIIQKISLAILSIAALVGAISSILFFLSAQANIIIGSSSILFGSVFEIDYLSALFFFIVNTVICIVALFSIGYLPLYSKTYNLQSVTFLIELFIFGMQLVLISTTPISFLAGWEIMSFTSLFLVFTDKQTESIKAGLLYLIMTHLGAGAILASFSILSKGLFFASFDEISIISSDLSIGLLGVTFALAVFGFGSKAGLWPFHVWLPEAHPQAPSNISALMSGVMLKVALYGFLRLALSVWPTLPTGWTYIIIFIGLITAVYGVLYAVVENDLKKILAYSSMENLGLLFSMVGVALFAQSINQPLLFTTAITAVIIHTFAHALFKSGLFMGAGVIMSQAHSRSLEVMGGLAHYMPKFSGLILFLILTAVALPPFSGFIGEWIFLQEIINTIISISQLNQGLLITVLATFSFVGGLSIFAMVRMFALIFLAGSRSKEITHAKEPNFLLSLSVALTVIASVILGLGAPSILKIIGLGSLTINNGLKTSLALTDGNYNPLLIGSLIIGSIILVFSLRYIFSKRKFERAYHTWDCGQPINSQMEYTATAFSAPIRFFFNILFSFNKKIIDTRIIPNNKWMISRHIELNRKHIWFELFYRPIARLTLLLSTLVRRIQNGIIQFYISLIVLALISTVFLSI